MVLRLPRPWERSLQPPFGCAPSSLNIFGAECQARPVAALHHNGGGVMGVEPIHALAHTLLLPFARHFCGHSAWVGQRRTERRAPVFVGFPHHGGGPLAPDLLIAPQGG